MSAPGGRVLRVVLTGSECTGKTTLAAALAARHGTAWSREYAREYLDRVKRPLRRSDVEPIALGQVAGEDAAERLARRLLILDTDLVSTVVYSRHYYDDCPEWIDESARARLADLYLLHHPDVPWMADGSQRDRPTERDDIHALFAATLAEMGGRVADIRGPWTERRERAERAIDRLLAEGR